MPEFGYKRKLQFRYLHSTLYAVPCTQYLVNLLEGIVKRMTITITVSEEVVRRLNDLSIAQADDVETKLQRLLAAEYQRRLARYRITDRSLSQKYGMAFEEFERRQVTRQQEYSWEAESDAIAWETAIDGIQTIQQQLTGLHELKNEY